MSIFGMTEQVCTPHRAVTLTSNDLHSSTQQVLTCFPSSSILLLLLPPFSLPNHIRVSQKKFSHFPPPELSKDASIFARIWFSVFFVCFFLASCIQILWSMLDSGSRYNLSRQKQTKSSSFFILFCIVITRSECII